MENIEKIQIENEVLRYELKEQMQRQRRLEIENSVLREAIRRIADITKSENVLNREISLTIDEIRYLADTHRIYALVYEWILDETHRSAEEEEKNER